MAYFIIKIEYLSPFSPLGEGEISFKSSLGGEVSAKILGGFAKDLWRKNPLTNPLGDGTFRAKSEGIKRALFKEFKRALHIRRLPAMIFGGRVDKPIVKKLVLAKTQDPAKGRGLRRMNSHPSCILKNE